MTTINHRNIALAALLALTTGNVFAQNAAVNNAKLETVKATKTEMLVQDDNPYALPWASVAMNNISWKKRVWRHIDASARDNAEFGAGNAINSLAASLLQGVLSGKIKAYSAIDDRFTKELTREEIIALITPGGENKGHNIAGVTKYEIKEDWLFLKQENKLIVRILGLAPVAAVKGADGKLTEQPLFWIYYPDSREYLAQQKWASGQSWDQLLESHTFKSAVLKDKIW